MLGLLEFKRYRHSYAHCVYANSTVETKKRILDNFSDWTKLELPDSTSLLFANWPKAHCGATKIEIDLGDILEFEAQLKEKYPQLYSEIKTKALNEDERARWNRCSPKRFWNPFSAKKFKTASMPEEEPIIIRNRPYLDIFINLDDEKKVLIYMIYSAF